MLTKRCRLGVLAWAPREIEGCSKLTVPQGPINRASSVLAVRTSLASRLPSARPKFTIGEQHGGEHVPKPREPRSKRVLSSMTRRYSRVRAPMPTPTQARTTRARTHTVGIRTKKNSLPGLMGSSMVSADFLWYECDATRGTKTGTGEVCKWPTTESDAPSHEPKRP